MNDFELPSNIKQIGSIGDGPRIYVEDYVCTYLRQYAESGGHSEKIAFLIGKYLVIDSQPVIFINGAVQGKYSEFENGIETFTQKSFVYAEQQMERYFKGFEFVGWMQSQPGYGTFLNRSYVKYHMMHFRKPYQMMFVMDPIEKLSTFYSWSTELTDLDEVKGYFVYYDKNPGMQEYMIDNKLINLDMKEKEIRISHGKEREKARKEENAYIDGSRSGQSVRKKPVPRHHDITEGKRLVNMLVSLSAVLFIICFIMGAGLVQNDDRIKQLETNLKSLNNAYTYIAAQIKQASTQPVFANQEENNNNTEIKEEITSLLEETAESDEGQMVDLLTDEDSQESDSVENPEESEVEPELVAEIIEVNEVDLEKDEPETYVVQKGDNLNSISKTFYGTTDMVSSIMEANGMTDPDKIYFGKILILPSIKHD